MNDESERTSGLTIIDGHSHIASTHFTPMSFLEGVADNIEVRLRPTDRRLNRVTELTALTALSTGSQLLSNPGRSIKAEVAATQYPFDRRPHQNQYGKNLGVGSLANSRW